MHSCLYEGRVWHRRERPVNHGFRYRLFMAYLDLDELPRLVPELVSGNHSAGLSFQHQDHLLGHAGDLASAVRQLVRERTGMEPGGPIRLLTQLRSLGRYFSPLNMFYCFDPSGSDLQCAVAEVNNTPWGEQHCYVLWEGNRVEPSSELRFTHAKTFHVSPFMDMRLDYEWTLHLPADQLRVRISNSRAGDRFFQAGLVMRRRELDRPTLRRMAWRYPLQPAGILAAIYFEAFRLWMKRCPTYSHPKTRSPSSAPGRSETLVR
ncbi:MAG: DUF1365 domain-containing protein [Pirellulaceae bacterium]|nr:DUF1365 domain-containing protein [Pirellulaceae bacterium]